MNNFLYSITQSNWLKPYIDRFSVLSSSDQTALKILAGFIAGLLFYFLLLEPSYSYKENAETVFSNNSALNLWMKENESRARNMGSESPDARGVQGSLLSLVDSSAKAQNIQLQRYEPNQNNGVRVWLENANFNNLVIWLEELASENAVTISQLTI